MEANKVRAVASHFASHIFFAAANKVRSVASHFASRVGLVTGREIPQFILITQLAFLFFNNILRLGLSHPKEVYRFSTIKMKIFVMTMDGKRIQLEVQPTDTVQDIRKLIENMEGTSPENQNLKFAGKTLDKGTMEDYNIQKESIVHMVQRFKGGS